MAFGVYYCGQECRAAHWKEHKKACKEVRALSRAAVIFTELYHEVLREAWDIGTPTVTEGEDGFREIQSVGSTTRHTYLGLPPYQTFLSDQFTRIEAQTVLCLDRCEDVQNSGITWPLFDQLMRCESQVPYARNLLLSSQV